MRGVSGREWTVLSERITPPQRLIDLYGRVLAQLLVNRGFEDQPEKVFDLRLSAIPSYRYLPNIEEGAERILRAIRKRERIIIFGDYDVDGITGTAILYEVLRKSGARVVPVVPSRGTGYGLSDRLLTIFSRYGDLLIAVDNGSSAVSEFESFPLDVIVIDHHNVPENRAHAILINPRISEDSPREMRELSSSAMCFYMATLIASRLNLDIDTRLYLDLVAMGTVADVMPLNYLNRILVSKGTRLLRSILEGKVSKPGIRALLEVSRVSESPSSKDIAYSIAPRLNAPGRMGDPRLSLELITERNPLRARVLSRKIELINNKRRAVTGMVLKEAMDRAKGEREESFIALWSPRWHSGVLGIVAGRLSRTLGKPVAVLAMGEEQSVGSVRSAEGINIYEGLRKMSEMFIKWGGHPHAAGITVPTKDLERFRETAKEVFSEVPREIPPLQIDLELAPWELTPEVLREISRLEPFGEGNPYPTFLSPPAPIEEVDQRNGSSRILFGGKEIRCWEESIIPFIRKGIKRRIVYTLMNGELNLIDIEANGA